VFLDEFGEELQEALLGFTGENERVGEQAVTYGVEGRGGFSFFGDGTQRFLAVDARCFDLFVCSHFGFSMWVVRGAENVVGLRGWFVYTELGRLR